MERGTGKAFRDETALIGLVGFTGTGRRTLAGRLQGRLGEMSSWSTVELRKAARRDIVTMLDRLTPSCRPFWTLNMKRGTDKDAWIDGKTNEPNFAKLVDSYYRIMLETDPEIWWRRSSIMYKRQVRGRGIVVPDIADVGELKELKKIGGIFLRVRRPGVSALSEAEQRSVDEMDRLGIYYDTVDNDSGLTALTAKFRKIILELWPDNSDLVERGVLASRTVRGELI